jgi:hypothetical protein
VSTIEDREWGWKKSSFSDGANQCVELRQDLGGVGDTKSGQRWQLPPSAVKSLVEAARRA